MTKAKKFAGAMSSPNGGVRVLSRGNGMIVNVEALRLQAWRAERLYHSFVEYAKSIGCTVIHDEIISDDEQARLLANWWLENVHANG